MQTETQTTPLVELRRSTKLDLTGEPFVLETAALVVPLSREQLHQIVEQADQLGITAVPF